MSEHTDQSPKSWDTSIPTLVISAAAAVLVPPSRLVAGISAPEQQVASAILPLLGVAIALAVMTVAMSARGRHRSSGFWGILSLVTIDVGVFLSWQYASGTSTVPLLIGVATIPFAVLMAQREAVWRREDTRKLAVEK